MARPTPARRAASPARARTAYLCRDKPSMKEALRKAGVARRSRPEPLFRRDRVFAAQVGYPLIVKPRAAAGASGTIRVDSDASSKRARVARRDGRPGRGGRGVRRGPRRLLRHHQHRRRVPRTSSSRTTTRTCWRRCASAGSARSSSRRIGRHQSQSTTAPRVGLTAITRSASGPRRRTWSGSTAQRTAVSEIGCRPGVAPGTSTRLATTSTSTTSGRTRSSTHSRPAALPAVCRRDRRAPPRSRRPIEYYEGVEEVQRRFGPWILDTTSRAARQRNRSRPATWQTPGSGWHIPTTTPCIRCSTSSARRSRSAPRAARDAARSHRRRG